MILNSANESPNRKSFWDEYQKNDKIEIMKKYADVSIKDKLIESTKGFLFKVGMLDIITRKK